MRIYNHRHATFGPTIHRHPYPCTACGFAQIPTASRINRRTQCRDANIHPDMHDAMVAGGMDGQIHVETRLIASLRCPDTFPPYHRGRRKYTSRHARCNDSGRNGRSNTCRDAINRVSTMSRYILPVSTGEDANIHPDMHDAMVAGGMDGQTHVETRLIASLRCTGTFHNIIGEDANKRLYILHTVSRHHAKIIVCHGDGIRPHGQQHRMPQAAA